MDRVRRARFESKHLVELKRDDDAEDEREPEGHVEQEECFPPPLAQIRSQPCVLPWAAAASGLPRRRPPHICKRRRVGSVELGMPSRRTPSGARGRGTHLLLAGFFHGRLCSRCCARPGALGQEWRVAAGRLWAWDSPAIGRLLPRPSLTDGARI
jgi:hypothetical protein